MYAMQVINWEMQGYSVLAAWGNRTTATAKSPNR